MCFVRLYAYLSLASLLNVTPYKYLSACNQSNAHVCVCAYEIEKVQTRFRDKISKNLSDLIPVEDAIAFDPDITT